MAAHSSTLAWRIPGTGEPGGVAQSQTQLKWLSSSSSRSREPEHLFVCHLCPVWTTAHLFIPLSPQDLILSRHISCFTFLRDNPSQLVLLFLAPHFSSPLLFFPLGHSIFRDGIHQAPSLLSLLFCLPHCPFCFPVCSFPCHFSCSYCFPFSSFQSLFLASLTPASFKFFFTLLMYNWSTKLC